MSIDRIANRLYLAFAIVICFGGTAAVVDWSQIDGLIKLSDRVANVYWPKTLDADRIIDNVNQNGQSTLTLIDTTDSSQMAASARRMNEASRELTGLYAQLDAKTSDGEHAAGTLALLTGSRCRPVPGPAADSTNRTRRLAEGGWQLIPVRPGIRSCR